MPREVEVYLRDILAAIAAVERILAEGLPFEER